ncbi:MAG: porin [Hyphomicrobiaceae bacterium]
MKTTTKFAIAAAVTALMGSTAYAADLGGSCCADLEERIAELEATTVRKGNRKVSVQISGFVGHNVMWWDDGTQSDTYIGDGGNIFSRWRLRGSAKISPELEAGFLYEFGVNRHSISGMNQGNGAVANGSGQGDDGGECTDSCLRDSTVYLKHKRLGMVKVGQGSSATDNLVLIDLGNRSAAGTMDIGLYNGAFALRNSAGVFLPGSWGNAVRGHTSFDTFRTNHVLYETPSLAGFTVQAAVAEDNLWDIALRYAGEFNGVRIAFGIGYLNDTEFNAPVGGITTGANSVSCVNNCNVEVEEIKGSASILHVPTGLFLTAAYANRSMDGNNSAALRYNGPDLVNWHLSGGLNKNFFGIGNTVLFGEYSSSEGGLEQARFLAGATDWTNTSFDQWGIGVNQYIDAAAMQIFATYKNFQLDGRLNGVAQSADFSTFIVGTRIDF